jgi:hypothetical protein
VTGDPDQVQGGCLRRSSTHLGGALLLWRGGRKPLRRLRPDQTASARSANAVASRWLGSMLVASS